MSQTIKALDQHTPKQIGENGNVEYTWSNNVKENILQFYFQLVRTGDKMQERILEQTLRRILQNLKHQQDTFKDETSLYYLSMVYRLIGNTRDMVEGKGEYSLTYMMIYVWYDYYPTLAEFALQCLLFLDKSETHPYGSWKDVKKFCQYSKEREEAKGNSVHRHPLVQCSIRLLNAQLKQDKEKMDNGSTDISLAGKWVPREKSKYQWLFQLLATHYFSNYLETAQNAVKMEKATIKCYMDYRKLSALLNRRLDTLQIKQCAKHWSEIDFQKVTSISLTSQKKAILNKKKDGSVRFPEDQDRIDCATNFQTYYENLKKQGKELKGARVSMESFTKKATELLRNPNDNQLEIDMLNSQWRDNSTQNGSLSKMIAMVDVSGSMEGDPMHVAIAMGIRVAEKSALGKRVMTFSSEPTWVNLSGYDDFVSQVQVIRNASWGMNTNFYKALKMILDAMVESKIPPEELEDLVLVVLSDMQMDMADDNTSSPEKTKTLYENIEKMYHDVGMKEHKRPYQPPHVLFWNLRSTSGFPSLSGQKNVSMMSGFNPSMLNLFCEQGIESLQTYTPWSQLETLLNNKRYDIMKTAVWENV
jgi:Mg-chelatase subunit ChlD